MTPGGPPAASGAPDGLVIGVLVGPHGTGGEVKLLPLTEFPDRIPGLKELRLRFKKGEEERLRVEGVRPHKGMFLVRLEGVATRSDAEDLRDAEVVIDLQQAAPLAEGRYYQHQILGLRVLTPEGEELGRVREIIEAGPNDVYVAGPYLIPATHDAVVRLAPEEGVLVVRSKEYLEGEEVHADPDD
jgi:16S rRNA processing protein RimM